MNQNYQIKIDFYPVKIRSLIDSWQIKIDKEIKPSFNADEFEKIVKKLKSAAPKKIKNLEIFFKSKEKRILSEKLSEINELGLTGKVAILFNLSPDRWILTNSIKYFMKKYDDPYFNKYLKNSIPKIKLKDKNWHKWLNEIETIFTDKPLESMCNEIIGKKIRFENIPSHYGLDPDSNISNNILKKLFSLNLINYLQNYDPENLINIIQTKKFEGVRNRIISAGIQSYYDDAINDSSHVFYQFIKRNYGIPDDFEKKHKWYGITENSKNKFKQWLIRIEIEDFFENVAGDYERLSYWKRQIKHVSAAYKVYKRNKDNPCCLVMTIKDLEFFEFPLKGNALYIYKKGVMEYQKRVHNESHLKDPYQVVNIRGREGRISHLGRWTYKVDFFISMAGK